MWYKHFSRNVRRDFTIPKSALATVARKSFNGKFTAKIDIPVGHFILPLLVLIEIWKKSYGQNYTKFWVFFLQKNHFWQSIDAILEDVSVTETIVWC